MLVIAKSGAVKNPNVTHNNNICRTMEAVYEAYGIDTPVKKCRFRKKYAHLLKEVSYKIGNRVERAVVASPELTENVGQLQEKFWLNGSNVIVSNNETNKAVTQSKKIAKGKSNYKTFMMILEEKIAYQFDGRLMAINGDIVDLESGEIVLEKEAIYEIVNEGKELDLSAFRVVIALKEIVESVKVVEKRNVFEASTSVSVVKVSKVNVVIVKRNLTKIIKSIKEGI